MPIQDLQFEDSSSKSGNLPWLNEYLADIPKLKEKEFLINEIALAQSGTGYRLICDYFQAWLWKNKKLTKMLVEALNVYADNPGTGYALFVVVKSKAKDDFTVGIDKEIRLDWFKSKNGFTTLKADTGQTTSTEGTNPFL